MRKLNYQPRLTRLDEKITNSQLVVGLGYDNNKGVGNVLYRMAVILKHMYKTGLLIKIKRD